jgi:hypothetical protein
MPNEPKRIQRKRAKGWRMPEGAIYCGRPNPFGNPFPVTKAKSTSAGVTKDIWVVGTWTGPAMWIRDNELEARRISVDAYRVWIGHAQQSNLKAEAVSVLRGKDLACWCRLDQKCHADVLLEIANA